MHPATKGFPLKTRMSFQLLFFLFPTQVSIALGSLPLFSLPQGCSHGYFECPQSSVTILSFLSIIKIFSPPMDWSVHWLLCTLAHSTAQTTVVLFPGEDWLWCFFCATIQSRFLGTQNTRLVCAGQVSVANHTLLFHLLFSPGLCSTSHEIKKSHWCGDWSHRCHRLNHMTHTDGIHWNNLRTLKIKFIT